MPEIRDIQRDWALFLDLDGTLLDIAPKPDLAKAPSRLPMNLMRLREGLGGALAIVSGRSLDVLDRILDPYHPVAGGEHGAVVRMPGGEIDAARAPILPRLWLQMLDRAAESWDGIVVERKPLSVVMHYRLAPEREADVRALVESLPGLSQEGFAVMQARMALEVKPKGLSKGRAVALLMEHPDFAGRTPVFVGDDVTDEDGIEMARKLGGFGLRVADDFGGEPENVRAWVERGVAA